MNSLKRIKQQVSCTALQAWLHLCRSPLQLHAVSGPDVLVFSGSPVCLAWQVSGCYKIVIQNRFVLPGSAAMVQLDADQLPEVLDIRFFGYRQQISKRFAIRKINLGLKKSPELKLPGCEQRIRPGHRWPELYAAIQLKAASPQPVPAIRPQPVRLPHVPLFHVPVLGLQLEPYYLQINQPDYETTVL